MKLSFFIPFALFALLYYPFVQESGRIKTDLRVNEVNDTSEKIMFNSVRNVKIKFLSDEGKVDLRINGLIIKDTGFSGKQWKIELRKSGNKNQILRSPEKIPLSNSSIKSFSINSLKSYCDTTNNTFLLETLGMDSLWYEISYTLEPGEFGLKKASADNFFILSDWQPVITLSGALMGDNTDKFSDIEIQIPSDYELLASENFKSKRVISEIKAVEYSTDNIFGFSAVFAEGRNIKSGIIKPMAGKTIRKDVLFKDENDSDDYDIIISNVIEKLSEITGYSGINPKIIELPYSMKMTDTSFNSLLFFKPEYKQPKYSLKYERQIANQLSREFVFSHFKVRTDFSEKTAEGLSGWIADVVSEELFGQAEVSFRIAKYYPIYGLNFIDFNQIPVIYTLGVFYEPPYAMSLKKYYGNPVAGSISNDRRTFISKKDEIISNKVIPSLVFHNLEREIGRERMIKLLKILFLERKHANISADFLNGLIKKITGEDKDYLTELLSGKPAFYNNRIKEIIKRGKNKYYVVAERRGDGIYPSEIALYTDKDTLIKKWDGKEVQSVIEFDTDNVVLGAEVDPARKNLFDLNFADNSYMLDSDYSSTFALSLKWLFWIQNFLMITGSAS